MVKEKKIYSTGKASCEWRSTLSIFHLCRRNNRGIYQHLIQKCLSFPVQIYSVGAQRCHAVLESYQFATEDPTSLDSSARVGFGQPQEALA